MRRNENAQPPEDVLVAVLDAVVFAAGEPVPAREIAEALGGMDPRVIEEALDTLDEEYRRRGGGLRLERVAGGVRLATRPEVGPWVRQFFRQRNRTRLSSAALETLAIIAYRQPVTAPEIQAIRGVDSSASLKSLVDKRLIRILGKKKVVGSPMLYGTSRQFLVHFGIDSLQDLPPIDDFQQLIGDAGEVEGPISEPVAAALAATDAQAPPWEETDPVAPTDRSEEE